MIILLCHTAKSTLLNIYFILKRNIVTSLVWSGFERIFKRNIIILCYVLIFRCMPYVVWGVTLLRFKPLWIERPY